MLNHDRSPQLVLFCFMLACPSEHLLLVKLIRWRSHRRHSRVFSPCSRWHSHMHAVSHFDRRTMSSCPPHQCPPHQCPPHQRQVLLVVTSDPIQRSTYAPPAAIHIYEHSRRSAFLLLCTRGCLSRHVKTDRAALCMPLFDASTILSGHGPTAIRSLHASFSCHLPCPCGSVRAMCRQRSDRARHLS